MLSPGGSHQQLSKSTFSTYYLRIPTIVTAMHSHFLLDLKHHKGHCTRNPGILRGSCKVHCGTSTKAWKCHFGHHFFRNFVRNSVRNLILLKWYFRGDLVCNYLRSTISEVIVRPSPIDSMIACISTDLYSTKCDRLLSLTAWKSRTLPRTNAWMLCATLSSVLMTSLVLRVSYKIIQ